VHTHTIWAEPRFWVSVAFVIFVVLFGARLWKALAQLLDRRTALIRAELDEAARLKQEAQAMLADARRRREDALREAEALLQSAQAEAARVGEAAHREAEAAARRRERMAMERIGAAEKAAVAEVRAAAADVATQAARSLLQERLSTDADARIVDQAIAGLPSALSARRAA